FCGATTLSSKARSSTIGQERAHNPVTQADDEAAFVREQIAGYGLYPSYYHHMRDTNIAGPRVLGAVPEVEGLSAPQVRDLLGAGVPLLDGRSRDAFAREHIPGAFNLELDSSFGSYVGWLLPFNAPLTLLIEDASGLREAVAQLFRIGFEQTQGYLEGGVDAWRAEGYPTATFERISVAELRHRLDEQRAPLAVLDVRDETEWRDGHIPGAQHLHIADLLRHMHETPLDRPVAVVCRSGFRASIGASIIAALGRQTIAVEGGVRDWIASGYPTLYGPGDGSAGAAHAHEHAHP
ncbi:MAG TPA: rhodanese-like domain-containing protein, partial [Ktedonobacterales bacterium]